MKAFLYAKFIFRVSIILALVACFIFCAYTQSAYAETAENARARVTITVNGRAYVYEDDLIIPSDFTVAEEIYMRRINAPLDKKLELVDMYLKKGADYKTALGVCFPLLCRTVDDIAKSVYVPPTDSVVCYKNGRFYATEDKSGVMIDENKLYAGIYYCFKFSGIDNTVNATTVPIAPSVTKSMLEANLVLRGEYSTDYSTSSASRAHNVSLALGKLDGVCIEKGGELSFNAAVGERTAENGFKSAKIIVDGNYTDGIGGGVCQASTALYNAALLSGLSCSANAHSICPSYCPPGLDAMISSVSDLVIKNTTEHDVYVSVKVGNGRATVRIFGETPEYTIEPESVITETLPCKVEENVDAERKYFDENAVTGDRLLIVPGKDGVKSETFLKYYQDGEFVKRIRIRENAYKSIPQIVAVAP